jgi:enamine deaminase RidA (YjgF/YER057c/UK114 family)
MSHTRIRPFNTRDTYPEQRLDNDLAQAVIAHGTTVFLRGQVAQDLETSENVGVGDPVAQTDQVMRNIQQLLTECGAGMGDLCRIVVYLTDIRHREAVYRTMGAYLKGVHPVSTGIVVQALARPEWLVEIEATAVIPETPLPAELDPNIAIATAEAAGSDTEFLGSRVSRARAVAPPESEA